MGGVTSPFRLRNRGSQFESLRDSCAHFRRDFVLLSNSRVQHYQYLRSEAYGTHPSDWGIRPRRLEFDCLHELGDRSHGRGGSGDRNCLDSDGISVLGVRHFGYGILSDNCLDHLADECGSCVYDPGSTFRRDVRPDWILPFIERDRRNDRSGWNSLDRG
jgi:hypothetical protein